MHFMKYPLRISIIALAGTLMMPENATGAESGAWDDFFTEEHADGWAVYDYFDEAYYFPQWFDGDGGDIYFYHTDDNPLYILTDVTANAGGGVFIGDYHAEEIQAIQVDVLIDSLDDFDFLDCVIYASDGPGGEGYYYSEMFLDIDFDERGWWTLRFGFDEDWEYFDGTSYIAAPATPAMLASIEEIGIRFVPKAGTTEDWIAAIDNVKLEPLVRAPEVVTSHGAGVFNMSFSPPKGNGCTIQKLDTSSSPATWQDVVGEIDITGNWPYLFSTPTTPGTGIFRVASSAYYVPITPPAP